jgi:hypothetical protein
MTVLINFFTGVLCSLLIQYIHYCAQKLLTDNFVWCCHFLKKHALMRFSHFIEHYTCSMLEVILAVGS